MKFGKAQPGCLRPLQMWRMVSSGVQGGQCQQRKEEGDRRQGNRPQVVEEGTTKKAHSKTAYCCSAHCLQKMQRGGYLCPAAKQSSELYLQSTLPLLPLSSWSLSQVPANSSSLLACCKVAWLVVGASSSARGTERLSGVWGE